MPVTVYTLLTGSGAVESAGAYVFAWAHGLGTRTPGVDLFRLTADGNWTRVPQTEFDATSTDADNLALSLAYTPPVSPHAGALKAFATNLDELLVPAALPAVAAGASQLGTLLGGVRSFLAQQLPATITIAGQAYGCATSGLRREQDLLTGGWLNKWRVSFWLPSNAFALAGQPAPTERARVTYLAKPYVVTHLPADPTGATTLLACSSPDA